MARRPKQPQSNPFNFDNGFAEGEEAPTQRGYQSGGRLVPIPDPTALTAKLVASAIADFRRELDTRLSAMDKAADLLHEDYTRVPTAVDRAVLNLRELLEAKIANLHADITGKIERNSAETDEKFIGVEAKFTQERITRTERAGDTKLAVDAAFAAAKEATGKIEAGFTKQIDAAAQRIDTMSKNLEDKITDLKDRIVANENRLAGSKDSYGSMVSVGGLVVAAIAMLVSFWAIAQHMH